MEQSKHSEEKIIKLGNMLVEELELENAVNTLARWMAHYLAQLMENINKAKSNEEKKRLQQECCDVILSIWSQKDYLPIRKPLDNFKPVIEILQVLNESREVNISPRWIEYSSLPRENEWAHFVDIVKNNSEKIFSKVVQFNLHKDILNKDEEWMKENKSFLSAEEISFLEIIDIANKFSNSSVIDFNDHELCDNNKKRIISFFDDLENLINEQKRELLKIKKSYL